MKHEFTSQEEFPGFKMFNIGENLMSQSLTDSVITVSLVKQVLKVENLHTDELCTDT